MTDKSLAVAYDLRKIHSVYLHSVSSACIFGVYLHYKGVSSSVYLRVYLYGISSPEARAEAWTRRDTPLAAGFNTKNKK